jgi:hypothetical protein
LDSRAEGLTARRPWLSAKKGSKTPIGVAQLAQIVSGKNPLGRPLFEPITTGFWILVNIDTVRSLDQQYQP